MLSILETLLEYTTKSSVAALISKLSLSNVDRQADRQTLNINFKVFV